MKQPDINYNGDKATGLLKWDIPVAVVVFNNGSYLRLYDWDELGYNNGVTAIFIIKIKTE